MGDFNMDLLSGNIIDFVFENNSLEKGAIL